MIPEVAARFRKLAAEAEDLDRMASQSAAAGRVANSVYYRECAERKRVEASGFDARAAGKEFARPRARVSVGLNQAVLDIVAGWKMSKTEKARCLTRLLQEAVFAVGEVTPACPGEILLTAERDLFRTRWLKQCEEWKATEAAVQFELTRAEVSASVE